MAAHLLYAVAIAALLLPWLSVKMRTRLERRWNSGLMGILNVKIRLCGVVPDLSVQNVVLVANHVSWLEYRPGRLSVSGESICNILILLNILYFTG